LTSTTAIAPAPTHTISPAAQEAMANRAWDYYEARVNGRLARLLHPELGSAR